MATKTITIEIPVTAANALLDATSDAVLLRALAKALAGGQTTAQPAPKANGKAKVKPAAEKPARKPRKSSGDTTENAATLLTRMASGTEHSAEALKKSTGLDKAGFAKAVKLLADEGKIRVTGVKRGTRYTVA